MCSNFPKKNLTTFPRPKPFPASRYPGLLPTPPRAFCRAPGQAPSVLLALSIASEDAAQGASMEPTCRPYAKLLVTVVAAVPCVAIRSHSVDGCTRTGSAGSKLLLAPTTTVHRFEGVR